MNAGRHIKAPQHNQTDKRVAIGRPEGAGHVTFGDAAQPLLEQGFEPLPIRAGKKVPAVSRWSSVAIDETTIGNWCQRFPTCGVGLRTGRLVGLDIDVLDADRAHHIQQLAEQRFGDTLVRVGQWPKRLLLYRTNEPFAKLKSGNVEVLGAGQQFVAFGLHPGTGKPYYWPGGETPLEIELGDLPETSATAARAFLAEVAPGPATAAPRRVPPAKGPPQAFQGITRKNGLVVDGRDDWLSRIAFHCVHDALDRTVRPSPDELAGQVWARFCDSTDLNRPRQSVNRGYSPQDARRKVLDKLRLAEEGRLPFRDVETPEPEDKAPELSVEEGRVRLQSVITSQCDAVLQWHRGQGADLPTLGIKATVGLGKSRTSRLALLDMMQALRAEGLPHRILVFTPSHALAEETAEAWRAAGVATAVLRGYHRVDPVSRDPMCRDREMVDAAIAQGLSVQDNACQSRDGARCRFLDSCHKQRNRRDVAAADVVVAPYDALFSGLAFEDDRIAMLLVDEGCWQRAIEMNRELCVEDLRHEPLAGMGGATIGRGPVAAMADLAEYRARAADALQASLAGTTLQKALGDSGLSCEDCLHAARLEEWRKQEPGLRPGLDGQARQGVIGAAQNNRRIDLLARFWRGLADVLRFGPQPGALLWVCPRDRTGRHVIDMRFSKPLHESLRGKPILHLDATLRPDLARRIIPLAAIETIDVRAPHMHVRQVVGSFGKSMLCPAEGLPQEEARRRSNRLRECVDYVRWHARRVFPGRVLVVTYQAIEAAFDAIPNVEAAHFNAVAGLDCYKDVALLISIGRPLPPSQEVEALAAVHLGGVTADGYGQQRVAVHMRSGTPRSLSALRHKDGHAEVLRAAICDDELIQVIGRGRGVNRSANTPLDVHVLADVALPLIHDELTVWDFERPDILQQMLLAGVAVDSPGDAAVLHPQLFGSANEAKLTFARSVFKGQNPIYTSYREMTLKSAVYRRAGRGRGWQRVWWIDGDADHVRQHLEAALGSSVQWRPD